MLKFQRHFAILLIWTLSFISPSYCDNTKLAERISSSIELAKYFKSLSDNDIIDLIDASTLKNIGTGGTVRKMVINNRPVCIKVIPVGDKELHNFTVSNIYNLPIFYSYGFNSFGFTVWREVTAHEFTNDLVINHNVSHFPLMHHWRLIKYRTKIKNSYKDINNLAAKWCNNEQIRDKINDYLHASHSVVLFLEYYPETLDSVLLKLTNDPVRFDQEFKLFAQKIFKAITINKEKGFEHFDTHLNNILTDGQDIYIIDFGLVKIKPFTFTAEELKFYEDHKNFDNDYLTFNLIKFLSNTLLKDKTTNHDILKNSRKGNNPYYFESFYQENFHIYQKMQDFIDLFNICKQKYYYFERL